jgi:hypothetical protein
MSGQPQGRRLRPGRVVVYILVAVLAFALAAGVGAVAALMLGGEPGSTGSENSPPSEEQGNAQHSEKQGNSRQGEAKGSSRQNEEQDSAQQTEKQGRSQQSEADYVNKVGKLQSESVRAFLDSHDKLVHYDALTAEDVEQVQANWASLQGFTEQVGELDPPQKYEEQYEVFRSAIDDMHESTQIAYALAADPTSATQSEFEEYDRHANEAAIRLQRSNELLGRDFATLRGTQELGPT